MLQRLDRGVDPEHAARWLITKPVKSSRSDSVTASSGPPTVMSVRMISAISRRVNATRQHLSVSARRKERQPDLVLRDPLPRTRHRRA